MQRHWRYSAREWSLYSGTSSATSPCAASQRDFCCESRSRLTLQGLLRWRLRRGLLHDKITVRPTVWIVYFLRYSTDDTWSGNILKQVSLCYVWLLRWWVGLDSSLCILKWSALSCGDGHMSILPKLKREFSSHVLTITTVKSSGISNKKTMLGVCERI